MVKAVGALGVNISVGESRELIFLIGECCTSSRINFCCLYYGILYTYPTLLLILFSYPFIPSFPFSRYPSPHLTPIPSFLSLPPSLPLSHLFPPSLYPFLSHTPLSPYLPQHLRNEAEFRKKIYLLSYHVRAVPSAYCSPF